MFSGSAEGIKEIEKQRRFIELLLQKYTIGPQNTQVSSLIYSGDKTQLYFPFKQGSSNSSTYKLVSSLPILSDDGQNLKPVLENLFSKIYTLQNGAREDTQKSVVLFINKNTDFNDLTDELNLLKEKEMKLIVVAINSKVDLNQAQSIVASKDYVILLRTEDQIGNLVDQVYQKTLPGGCLL